MKRYTPSATVDREQQGGGCVTLTIEMLPIDDGKCVMFCEVQALAKEVLPTFEGYSYITNATRLALVEKLKAIIEAKP